VTNRAHVHVGLGTFEFAFCHFKNSNLMNMPVSGFTSAHHCLITAHGHTVA